MAAKSKYVRVSEYTIKILQSVLMFCIVDVLLTMFYQEQTADSIKIIRYVRIEQSRSVFIKMAKVLMNQELNLDSISIGIIWNGELDFNKEHVEEN